MKKMYLIASVSTGLLFLIVMVYCYFTIQDQNKLIAVLLISFTLCVVIMHTIQEMFKESYQEYSFNNPSSFSEYDIHTIFIIDTVQDDKVGLRRYSNNATEQCITYYWAHGIPQEILKNKEPFKIINTQLDCEKVTLKQ